MGDKRPLPDDLLKRYKDALERLGKLEERIRQMEEERDAEEILEALKPPEPPQRPISSTRLRMIIDGVHKRPVR